MTKASTNIGSRSCRAEGKLSSPWLCKQRDPEDLAAEIGDYMSRVEVDRGRDIDEIQPLNEDQDIDSLVEKFVKEIGL